MIAWTILAAKNCDLFDHVLVSTDDEEIAEVSKACGADVPFLRKHFADDVSSVSQATVAALNQAENYWKKEFRTVVQLMANCPLRNSKDIVAAVNTFDSKRRDFQISCFQYGWMNPWWAARLDSNNRPNDISRNQYREIAGPSKLVLPNRSYLDRVWACIKVRKHVLWP